MILGSIEVYLYDYFSLELQAGFGNDPKLWL